MEGGTKRIREACVRIMKHECWKNNNNPIQIHSVSQFLSHFLWSHALISSLAPQPRPSAPLNNQANSVQLFQVLFMPCAHSPSPLDYQTLWGSRYPAFMSQLSNDLVSTPPLSFGLLHCLHLTCYLIAHLTTVLTCSSGLFTMPHRFSFWSYWTCEPLVKSPPDSHLWAIVWTTSHSNQLLCCTPVCSGEVILPESFRKRSPFLLRRLGLLQYLYHQQQCFLNKIF